MSRIQTPTVAVNPNVEMANREAPTIVYQPEPYVPETYFDYEQLSNVLGAGVQAAQTFLKTSLLDRELQADVAARAAKERSDRFRVGLSEATLRDKEAQVGEKLESRYVRDYLGKIDYESLAPDDQELYNKTLGERTDQELDQQRKFNSDIFVGRFKSRVDQLKGRAQGGDQAAISALANVYDENQAYALVESLMDPKELATMRSVDSYDEGVYRSKLSTQLADVMGEAARYRAQIKKTEVQMKTDAMVRFTAEGVSDLILNPSKDLEDPEALRSTIEDLASNLQNVRAGARSIDRTLGDVDLDKIQDSMVMMAAEDIISRGSASQLFAFRNIMKQGTGIVMDQENRIKLMEKLDAEVKKKYESELRFDLDSLSAAQMDDTSVTTRSQNPMFKNQQLDNFANLARSRMYVEGPNGERIQVMDETEVNTMISNQKARIEAQDERYVPNKVYADATAIMKTELAKGQNARFDTAMNKINDTMLANGVLPDTPQWNAAYKNLGRFIDVEAAPQMEAMAKNQLLNVYGFAPNSLGPDAADDAKVPAHLRMRFNADKAQLRIQATAQHLRLALASKDSTGSSSSTAISRFRAGLVNLIGPNLEGPIPVELYDAAVLARDPIMRLNVFGAGSPNGDRLLRFLDMVNSAQGSASGRTMTDLMRAAQIEFTFDDARFGWTSIMSVDRESKFHKLKLDSITGEVLPVSTAWLRNLYASTFNDKMLETNGVYDQARALTGDLLEPLVLSVNGSALPANDIGARGAQHVMDMAEVLTGRDDVTFVVVGQDETGTGYLYGLRDMDGDEVTTDSAGNQIPNRLYTMQYVPEGVTSRFSLTGEAFDKQVKELNVKRGARSWWNDTPTYKKPNKSVTLEPQPGWRGWSQGMAQE
jgi:hypothetical protein